MSPGIGLAPNAQKVPPVSFCVEQEKRGRSIRKSVRNSASATSLQFPLKDKTVEKNRIRIPFQGASICNFNELWQNRIHDKNCLWMFGYFIIIRY
jgi:hypothetical protein